MKRRTAILSIIAVAMSLAACSSTSASAPSSSTAGANASTSASFDPKVTLLTHDSFVVSDELIKQLKVDTGIELNVVTAGDAGQMVAGAILTAGEPTADVLFGVDNTLVAKATRASVFEPYTSSELASVKPELANDTANGTLTPIDYGDVCINASTPSLKKANLAAPTSLEDLTKPEYAKQLVVEDPATSSPGLAFLLATIAAHPDDWQAYWQKLSDGGVKVAGSWTDAYVGDFSQGDRALVVSYATSPPAEIVYSEADPKPTKPSTSVMTQGCYRQVEYAGVLAGAKNPEGAKKVIDWLLSEPVQSDVPLSMFVFPAREGIELPEVFTKFAATVANPAQLPADEIADNLDEWLTQWGEVMGR